MRVDLREKLPGAARAARDAIGRVSLPSGFPSGISPRKIFDIVGLVLLFYFVEQFFLPAPPGVWVQGMIIGGLTALIAFGIALIYRANRIVNFAQGDLGGVPAALAVLLIVGPKLPFFLAMLVGIVAALVLGTVVETVIIRRFFRAPRLILTVATIGLAQILAAGEILLPRAFDLTIPPQSFPSPFDFRFEIYPIIFRGNDIIAMITVVLVIVALWAFFRFTDIGIAVRASADSSDRAFLLGIPVKRIHTIVWVLATLLATVAMLLRAGVIGLPIGTVLGPGILLRALAAAVIGRMQNLPVIFVASLALGIVEQSVVWHFGRGLLIDPILFVVVIFALLMQRRGEVTRVDDTQASSWQAAKEVRPVPRELAQLPEVRLGFRGLSALLVLFLAALPLLLSESRINLAGVILIFGIVGLSLVVLTGWAGQVSLGQIAFFGVGAAVGGIFTSRLGWDISLALIAAGLAGAVAAVIIGVPALRIRGLFLAVTTLSFSLAAASFLFNREFVPWLPEGRVPRTAVFGRIDVEPEARYYYLVLAGLLIAYSAVRAIRRSRTGRILIAARENERAAQAYGVNTTRAKLTAFALSGFLAAFAGGLFIHHQHGFGITPFAPEESLRAFSMVVIGGLGSVPGALIGAAYLRGVVYFLPPGFRFLASGVGVLLILMVMPGGLGSVIYGIRDAILRRVAKRRNLLVPSLVADSRVESTVPVLAPGLSGNGSAREQKPEEETMVVGRRR